MIGNKIMIEKDNVYSSIEYSHSGNTYKFQLCDTVIIIKSLLNYKDLCDQIASVHNKFSTTGTMDFTPLKIVAISESVSRERVGLPCRDLRTYAFPTLQVINKHKNGKLSSEKSLLDKFMSLF